jgi:hypothetical protein
VAVAVAKAVEVCGGVERLILLVELRRWWERFRRGETEAGSNGATRSGHK